MQYAGAKLESTSISLLSAIKNVKGQVLVKVNHLRKKYLYVTVSQEKKNLRRKRIGRRTVLENKGTY